MKAFSESPVALRFAQQLFSKAPRPAAKKASDGGSAKADRMKKEQDALAMKKRNDAYQVCKCACVCVSV